MHEHERLVRSFYEAFAKRDAEGMVACYADDVHFSDPVFPDLHGDRAKAMWRMLCERGKDLRIELGEVAADGKTAHWEAYYTFSGTGRRVHNIVDASFEFAGGKIARHDDRFDLWRWTRLAIGPAGTLLGWTPPFQGKLRKTAAKGLDAFLAGR
jgi:limonene-1,2-epoxide hydrolase